MIDWMPVEDPAFIGDPSSRTRSGTGMTGTEWDFFVIPAKAGIQRACRLMKSKSLNLGSGFIAMKQPSTASNPNPWQISAPFPGAPDGPVKGHAAMTTN